MAFYYGEEKYPNFYIFYWILIKNFPHIVYIWILNIDYWLYSLWGNELTYF